MYSFSYLEPVCCSMSSTKCCFLTCLKISQEAGQVAWYSYLFKDFTQFLVIHTIKVFNIVNKAEVDVFLKLFCFFNYLTDFGNLMSGSSAFSKSRTSGSSWIMYCWRLTCRILSSTSLAVRWVQLCGSLSILWDCPSLGLEWKLTFLSPVATAELSKFPGILSAALSQHHLLGFEIAQLEFHHLH